VVFVAFVIFYEAAVEINALLSVVIVVADQAA
jgi:hypothetical protein